MQTISHKRAGGKGKGSKPGWADVRRAALALRRHCEECGAPARTVWRKTINRDARDYAIENLKALCRRCAQRLRAFDRHSRRCRVPLIPEDPALHSRQLDLLSALTTWPSFIDAAELVAPIRRLCTWRFGRLWARTLSRLHARGEAVDGEVVANAEAVAADILSRRLSSRLEIDLVLDTCVARTPIRCREVIRASERLAVMA
jgi:hypothetical protein